MDTLRIQPIDRKRRNINAKAGEKKISPAFLCGGHQRAVKIFFTARLPEFRHKAEPVPDDITVGNPESDPVGMNELFGFQHLIHQDTSLDACCAEPQKIMNGVFHGKPRIKDIINQQNMSSVNRQFQCGTHCNLSGTPVIFVTGRGKTIDIKRQINLPKQIGGKNHCSVHHHNDCKLLPPISFRDFSAQLRNPRGNLIFRKKNLHPFIPR